VTQTVEQLQQTEIVLYQAIKFTI